MRSPRRPGSGTGSVTGLATESHAATQRTTGVLTAVLRIRDPVLFLTPGSSVADPDPGSGAFLTPGSGIPDPGSQTHTFESLVTIFWAKSSIIL